MVDTIDTGSGKHGKKGQVLMNAPKRRRATSPPPVTGPSGTIGGTVVYPPMVGTGAPPPMVGTGAPPPMVGTGVSPPVVGAGVPPPAVGQGSQVIGTAPPVAGVQLHGTSNNGKKVRNKRKPPRKLPVHTKGFNVWDVLGTVEAKISIADLVAMDRNICKDLMDGIRYLRQRKKVGPRKPVQMVIDSVQTVDSDSMVSSGSSTVSSQDSWSNDSFDSSDESFDEEESVYGYPYNLDRMKASSPLRGVISINGVAVECVFDSGASVSVISKSLADRVGLVPNGDTLQITGFDSRSCDKPANVVMDVPVMVGGCLRPEHMCVVDLPGVKDLCLLGVPWLKAYGIQPVVDNGVINIPTRRGIVSHQCYTTHASRGKRVNFLDKDGVVAEGSGLPTIEEVAGRLEKNPSMEVFAVLTGMAISDGAPGSSNSLEPLSERTVLNAAQVRQKEKDLLQSYEEGVHGNLSESDVVQEDEEIPEVLKALIEDYSGCFVENAGLGRVKGFTHKIELKPGSQPVRSVPFRLTWEENEFLAREIKEMLELGIIRPSDSGTFSSPCFFVKKKDGSRRIVIDYRNLNRITVPFAHPLPLIAELLDSLGGARYFTTMDLAFGYWQVPMEEDSIEKTGFVTKQGIFEFLVMPFGLCTAPSRFQSMMNTVLKEYIGVFCLVFIDDVLIYGGETIEEHAHYVELVLVKCKEANLRIKKKKCSWGRTEVSYLGHKVTSDGLLPGDHNVNKIKEFKVPSNASEVKSFLGLCSYYRSFIPDYAKHAEPLQQLVKKNKVFTWDKSQVEGFEFFKRCLISPPLLAYPNRQKVQVLTVDGSSIGLGAILSQVDDLDTLGNEEVVSYASRTLRGPERNYAITHIEALAVVWGVQHYRHFLLGRKFLLVTDHLALKYIFNPSKKTPKLGRWAGMLMEYDFKLVYRRGSQNPADPLSRLMVTEHSEVSLLEDCGN
ncbi:hypothetical protein G6F43_010692 [Rhizopus delemar]|nr:hypothetical protein G6F43_010692 [Rhizopus delemar]